MTARWPVPPGLRLAGSLLAAPERDRRAFAAGLAADDYGVHLDLIDESYPRRYGVDPGLVPLLLTDDWRPVDVHLMVADPAAWVADLLRPADRTPDRITVQVEDLPATDRAADVRRLTDLARASGTSLWLAVAPSTDPGLLDSLSTGLVDGALVMLTPPGGYAEVADPSRLNVVRRFSRRLPVGVDGGVTSELLPALGRAGASYAVSGRALAQAVVPRDPRKGAAS